MKNAFFVLLFFPVWLACNTGDVKEKNTEENNPDLLSTELVHNPRSLNIPVDSSLPAGKLLFSDTVHHFGQLNEGEKVQYQFEMTNIGSEEIIITRAEGSCGCTVPEYEQKPLPPGQKSYMLVTFDSQGKGGHNEKHVKIKTNGIPSEYKLTILADVK